MTRVKNSLKIRFKACLVICSTCCISHSVVRVWVSNLLYQAKLIGSSRWHKKKRKVARSNCRDRYRMAKMKLAWRNCVYYLGVR